jgi:hypothetical protein
MSDQIPVPRPKYSVVCRGAGPVRIGLFSGGAAIKLEYEAIPEVLKRQMSVLDMAIDGSDSVVVPGVGDRFHVTRADPSWVIYYLCEIPSLDYTEVDNYLRCSREYLT